MAARPTFKKIRFQMIGNMTILVDFGRVFYRRALGIHRGRLSPLEIGPDAMWEATRVSFGGDYESAFHLAGGMSPVDSKNRRSTRSKALPQPSVERND